MDNGLLVQNIEKLCEERNIAPTVACEQSGAKKDFIANLRRGSSPSVAKVQMLARYLGVTTSQLLGEEQLVPDEDELRDAYGVLSRAGRARVVDFARYVRELEDTHGQDPDVQV